MLISPSRIETSDGDIGLLKRLSLTVLILLIAACGGRSSTPAAEASAAVTGTVTYRERMLLPPDAVIQVSLVDVSLMDVPAKLISRQEIRPEHAVPIAFKLPYDPEAIDERMTYAVQARISSGDKLLFITDTSYQVLTRGQPDHIDLVLKRVQH
jgi:putative lipoprotein